MSSICMSSITVSPSLASLPDGMYVLYDVFRFFLALKFHF